MDYEEMKRAAALEAVKLVESGMIVGLGTGSTAKYAIEELARRLREGELEDVVGVPTSRRSEELARDLGIPILTDFEEVDIDIDGADEIDPNLNLTKGGGGALLREKVVAKASKRVVIIADERKLVQRLGTRMGIPVEVLPFGLRATMRALRNLGCKPRPREGFITDNGNLIVDCLFPGGIDDPGSVEAGLLLIPGVLEVGIFCGIADEAVVGTSSGVRRLSRIS